MEDWYGQKRSQIRIDTIASLPAADSVRKIVLNQIFIIFRGRVKDHFTRPLLVLQYVNTLDSERPVNCGLSRPVE
jgi:hypothetical protein